MGLMDRFADPDIAASLGSVGKMTESAVTILMGMGIAFCVLMILWGSISITGRVMSARKAKDNVQDQLIPAAVPVALMPVMQKPVSEEASDDALAAVIAAAVAAYEGGSPESALQGLKIKKIRRVSGGTTPWSYAGREECLDRRKY